MPKPKPIQFSSDADFLAATRSCSAAIGRFLINKQPHELRTARELLSLAEVELLLCGCEQSRAVYKQLQEKLEFYSQSQQIILENETLETVSEVLSRAGEEMSRADEALSEAVVVNFSVSRKGESETLLLQKVRDDSKSVTSDAVILKQQLLGIVKKVANNKVLAVAAMAIMLLALILSIVDVVKTVQKKIQK